MEAIPSLDNYINFEEEDKVYTCIVHLNSFIPDEYTVYAWLGASEAETYDWVDDKLGFEITDSPTPKRTFPFSTRTGSQIANSYLIP